MKKVTRTAVVVTVAAMLLAACSSVADGSVDSGEIVVPEMSSEDLLVSSLEYLLQEDRDAAEEAEEPSEPAPLSKTEKTQEENEGTKDNGDTEAVIYYGSAGSYDLNQEIIQIEEKTAEELLGALAKHNIVSLDTKALSLEEKEDSGRKMLYLDLSRAAGEYLKTMSREAECVILASVVNTFLENYDADGVYIAVDGKPLETKNAVYENAMEKCTPEELLERIEQQREDSEQKERQEAGTEEETSDKITGDVDSVLEEE